MLNEYIVKRDKVVSGGDSIVVYEEWRSHADGLTWETSEILKAIRDYNIDDCNSTQELAEWLRLQQSTHKIEYSRSSDEEVKIEDEEEPKLRNFVRNSLIWPCKKRTKIKKVFYKT